jgi:alpha-L-rhamnosidase
MLRSALLIAFVGLGLLQPDSGPPQQARSAVLPAALRTEYLVDPLAIDTREPRLSWIVEAGDTRGVTQSAYQIMVASSAENLAADRGDLWDTDRVSGNQTIHIEYKGKPLTSRQEAFWKVRIWDQNASASTWSSPARWRMGLLEVSDWSAQWIGDRSPSVDNPAATMLRRSFTLAARPRTATVYATALGAYELYINGQRVGDQILAPEFTDYHTRTQYQVYDVTTLLRPGENVIAGLLGDGWYAGGIGLAQMLIKQPRNIYGDHPRLLVQLEMESPVGKKELIVTDGRWRVTREGPIRSSDILNGEIYDARKEMPGWDRTGFDDQSWTPADVATEVTTQLVAQPNEPIRITRDLAPIAVTQPKPGVYVFDLGQNMVGWSRLKVKGVAGTTVTLIHAEMLQDDGTVYTENLRAASQTDSYTLRGTRAEETFEPHFTYHGFRYVQVTGLPARPQVSDLVGRQINSSMREVGTFESSSRLANQLWQNVLWTQRDNMISIPTDCPQRDERLGWMGDIQVFVGTSILNADMGAFFTKWMRDVRDAQTPDGRFADFSPQPFQKTLAAMNRGDFMGVPGWGDAGVVVPWRLWQHYGDRRQLAENYESSRRWIEFIRRNNPELLWINKRHNDYGDWLNADAVKDPSIPPVGAEVPKPVFATMMFAHATDLVARMATVLGKEDEARELGALFDRIKAAFNAAYVSEDGRIEGQTQAGYALALHFDLLPESKRGAAVDHMLEGIAAYNGHMSTGFHSTYRMMLELTRAGRSDVAYQLINHTSFPSWGYSIENGATTIWERWDGYVKGRGFQDKGMNSFNHYAIGAVAEWMYRVIVGINNDDASPAYQHFVLHPIPGGGLTWAKGSYESIRGRIESSWKIEAGRFTLDVTIPANTTATVFVPARRADSVTEGGRPAAQARGVQFVRMEGEAAVYRVQSGRYSFAVR